MKLKTKVVVGLLAGVAALQVGLFVTIDSLVLTGFASSEHAQARAEVQQTREIVAQMLDEFRFRMNDWAQWDDMARFVADGNAEFVESNIAVDALSHLQWDTAMVTTPGLPDRLLVALDAPRAAFVDPEPDLVAHLRDPRGHGAYGPPRVGLVALGNRLWIAASQDVKQTDGSAPPRAGRFATASRVDAAWIARLAKFTGRDVTLAPRAGAIADRALAEATVHLATDPTQGFAIATSEEDMSAFALVPDLYGNPEVVLREDRARPMQAQAHTLLASVQLGIAVLGAAFAGLAWLTMRRVLRRLDAVAHGVQALERGERRPVPVTADDEIGTLAASFNSMSQRIAERERSLAQVNERMRLVLDSIGDGLVRCDPDGSVADEVSRSAAAWFGKAEGTPVWQYLFAPEDPVRAEFELAWSQIRDDFLPYELAVDQLPRRVRREGREYDLRVERVLRDGTAVGFLLVVRDVTDAVLREAAQREAAELQEVLAGFARDPGGVGQFLTEMDGLIERIVHGHDEAEYRRDLHTLKGTAAVHGFASFAARCHAVETALAEGQALALHASALQVAWLAEVAKVRTYLPDAGQAMLTVPLTEFDQLVEMLRSGAPAAALHAVVESWRQPLLSRTLSRLAHQATRAAATLGRRVEVVTDACALRHDPRRFGRFWESFVHLIRNAVDHGIEPEAERTAAGKPAAGRIELLARRDGGQLTVQLADDGRGIDWAGLTRAAAAKGLPHHDNAALVAAMFADGVSSRAEVDASSGRGVGLAAVREEVERLGGRIEVTSRPGRGTTFTFRLPLGTASRQLESVGV